MGGLLCSQPSRMLVGGWSVTRRQVREVNKWYTAGERIGEGQRGSAAVISAPVPANAESTLDATELLTVRWR
ncbi:hypothetical protein GCM10008940_01700 [Microbulbifer agarilyticus]